MKTEPASIQRRQCPACGSDRRVSLFCCDGRTEVVEYVPASQLAAAVQALEHLASPNWTVKPTGADAQAMAGFAADALTRLRGRAA